MITMITKNKAFVLASLILSCTCVLGEITRETHVYAEKDGKELHLDVYRDDTVKTDAPRPVMFYVHGGGFSMGSRINALQIKYLKHFVSKGYVAISNDYRLGLEAGAPPDMAAIPKAVRMACEDLVDATTFTLKMADEWNIDPQKIIISGGSAGAITCLTTEYDLCAGEEYTQALPEGFNYAGIVSHAGSVVIPGEKIAWAKNPCPMLLMHGDKDQAVGFGKNLLSGLVFAGSNHIHEQLVEMDSPHWLYEEKGADHIVALSPLQHNFPEIDTFLEKFVMDSKHAIVHTKWTDEEPGSMAKMAEIVPLYIFGWGKTDEEMESGNN